MLLRASTIVSLTLHPPFTPTREAMEVRLFQYLESVHNGARTTVLHFI